MAAHSSTSRTGRNVRRTALTLDTRCRLIGLCTLEPEYRFHPTRKWKFDFCLPSRSIGIEVEGGAFIGGRHTRGAGFEKDLEKYAEAAILGWTVLRVTPKWVADGRAVSYLQRLLANEMVAGETANCSGD